MAEINDKDSYIKRIRGGGGNDRLEKCLEKALDIRKFEIELYWKRAAYFWTFIAAAFVGFLALLTGDAPPKAEAALLLSCIGLVLSVALYIVNRGSKYWQTNWELHVDLLEDEVLGPLYKTIVSREQFKKWHLFRAYPFSVSKINQILSFFVVSVWLFLVVYSLFLVSADDRVQVGIAIVFIALTVIFIYLMLTKGKTSDGEIKLEFDTRQIKIVEKNKDTV